MLTVRIQAHERGLYFRDGQFVRFLTPGRHRLWGRLWCFWRTRIEVYNTLQTRFAHPQLDILAADERVRSSLVIVDLAEHQRGLIWLDGRLAFVLGPGRHTFWKEPRTVKVDVLDTRQARLTHELLDVVLEHPDIREQVEVVDLQDTERALAWRDGRLVAVVGGGRYAFWKAPGQLQIERFDARQQRLEHPRLEAVAGFRDGTTGANTLARTLLEVVQIQPQERGLLLRAGRLVETLDSGLHVFWLLPGSDLRLRKVDLREQVAEVPGQEIMTNDKVTLRCTLLVTYRVQDPLATLTVVADFAQSLYREAQLALRVAIAGRTLDGLLGNKEAVGREVHEAIARRAAEFGLAIRSVGLRDIILPGEMRAILNEVVTAEKKAQANLIRRREETAAARNQANTAKLLADNPQLARMKELEAVQEILAGTHATIFLAPGDIVAQMRALTEKAPGTGDNGPQRGSAADLGAG